MQKNCCPGQHDCSAMINFSKSLPKMQASILIFRSPCGTLAFFCSHEKPPFLNSNWFSVGWRTRKTPLDHFLLLTWNLLTLCSTNGTNRRKTKIKYTGAGGGCSHTWARKVRCMCQLIGYHFWWSRSSNRISFLPLEALCLQFDP